MLENQLHSVISAALPQPVTFTLEPAAQPQFGHIACNAAMLLAKELGRNPREIATELAEKIAADEIVEKAEVAGPGFVNIWLTDAAILAALPTVDAPPVSDFPQRVLVEAGSENIAKPMSVGHLRSNLIGMSLVHIFRFLGSEVITDNHLGDWGTQFGKLIVAYRTWGDKAVVEQDFIPELNKLYVRFHDEAGDNPALEDEARDVFRQLEEGDPEIRALWNWMKDESLKTFQVMYDRLGSHYDHIHGEAFFEDALPGIIADLLEQNIAEKNDGGSIMVSFPEEFSPSPMLIQKSDGATLYATRDLATVKFYVEEFAPDVVLQCVGNEQSLHFKQFYDTATRAGYMGDATFVHVKNGLVRLPEGKMSTRGGKTIRLEDLLDTAAEKMAAILNEKNCEIVGEERVMLTEQLAVGAVKFADLGRDREGDITFTWDDALSFDGYAAPYLMYTHARACSILRKSESPLTPLTKGGSPAVRDGGIDDAERQLALQLDQFGAAVMRAAEGYKAHHIAQYLFALAQEFNSFYQKLPVLNAEHEEEKQLRLQLVERTTTVLKTGLGLLGIAAPERM